MRGWPLLVLLVVLSGCWIQGRYGERMNVRGPDGRWWFTLRCGIREDCLRLAGEACANGYEVTEDNHKSKHARMVAHCKEAAPPTPASSAQPPAVTDWKQPMP